jgi:hypothetical protein
MPNIYLILLLTLILGFIFYCHIYQFIKQTNHYEILQVSNPTPDNLEKILLDKSHYMRRNNGDQLFNLFGVCEKILMFSFYFLLYSCE